MTSAIKRLCSQIKKTLLGINLLRNRRPRAKPVINAIQIYDNQLFGYPLAVFEVSGQFQDIAIGDTMDGKAWKHSYGHTNYAQIYRVVSIRHTLSTLEDGSVQHLKSIFVEAVVPSRRTHPKN